MKTLYLDGCAELEVRLDGPALRVRRPQHADGQYPLPRISRVVSIGRVHWTLQALEACLREHKPVAVLDSRGRFVRLLFRSPQHSYGLARHLGELLAVPRFRARYEHWYRTAERTAMTATLRRLDIRCVGLHPDRAWQLACLRQFQLWGFRTGSCHRYLLGLAAAQIASALAILGLPKDPEFWMREEYRLFTDLLALERWQQLALLERALATLPQQPSRRELTTAFEAASADRERRIAAWRKRMLLAMMGLARNPNRPAPCSSRSPAGGSAKFPLNLSKARRTASTCITNAGRIPFGSRRSLRTSVRILRAYLSYDWRVYESDGKA
ncbi:MAG TPA: CRISPR-associated endonuclease Cas1 [Terriglobia bacterium]|nr:CRISPR-associated endonuclease Cas1 [Terriglobia bacterium]